MLRPMLTPHQRSRKRWAWTAAMVVGVGVWVGSSQFVATWKGARVRFDVMYGSIKYHWTQVDAPTDSSPDVIVCWLSDLKLIDPPFRSSAEIWKDYLVPHVYSWRNWDRAGDLPLWLFLLPMLVPTARAWLARTIPPGGCPRCGYDRTGLSAGAACPECNAAPPALPHSGHTTPAPSPARS